MYSIGLDYGTNSARCLVVDLEIGAEVGSSVFPYPSGDDGVILDSKQPELARQNPNDYVAAAEWLLKEAVSQAGITPAEIVGIGVDTTASTPLPLDKEGEPLSSSFADEPNALAWLWKDHTSHAEAAEITGLAAREHPEYLAKCGGAYSSEWFWSKLLRCARISPQIFEASHTWIEQCDFVTATLAGNLALPRRGICAAGHKGMFGVSWGGYPDERFLEQLHPSLARVRRTLPKTTHVCGEVAGNLTKQWAERTGLREGTPISVGGIDAHLGAVGSGIQKGTLVKILGTSSCDMAVWPLDSELPDIPGISGIVPESILPGMYGLEAGQAAVGDLFNWFSETMNAGAHDELSQAAAQLKPGECGLVALDWNNGNRCTWGDSRLTGLLVGQTLHTKPHEVYRALIEASAFGAMVILKRFEEYGVLVENIVACGGIADKSPLVLQVYADVTGRKIEVSRSSETCALGAAICGAVAGREFASIADAQVRMTGTKQTCFEPNAAAHAVYSQLFDVYQRLFDAFGSGQMNAMKELLRIRSQIV
jgi:L-ribulokinase